MTYMAASASSSNARKTLASCSNTPLASGPARKARTRSGRVLPGTGLLLAVTERLVTALGGITQRTVDPLNPAVVSVGLFQGGTAPNIIADTATCSGSIRTFQESDRSNIHDAITRLAEGTAIARGASATVQFTRGGPAVVNDPRLVAGADALLKGLGIPVADVPFRSCGSDDFSEYGEIVPSLMSFIGTGTGDGVSLHSAKFLPGRGAMRLSAIALAANYLAAAETLR